LFIEQSHKNINSGIDIYFKTLVELVDAYEKAHHQAPKTSGEDMLAYLMELQGLNQSDLSNELGGQSVVSQILKGKRELNLRQVKALAKRFKVSPEVFI
jgi:HTH-type transcriptional regulator/antitoxin HigA